MPRKSGYDDVTKFKIIIKKPIFQAAAETDYDGVFQQVNIPMKTMTVSEFQELANSPKYATPPHASFEELESIYWEKMTSHSGIYGADICGSISDSDLKHWNIRKLDSILDYVEKDYNISIDGVNTAYLYFGMFKTTFAFHTEDMELYSINYLHFGKPKTWYSIPPSHGKQFEEMMQKIFPKTHKVCSAFLRHKMTIVNPEFLKKFGIPYDKITQEAGQIMITFPNGYHSGFNHGFNCAESTNFATERWVEYGKHAEMCYCCPDSVKISMDAFVKRFQPDKFESWMGGEDKTPHPEHKQVLKRSQVSYKRVSFVERNPELRHNSLLDNPTIPSDIKMELRGSFLVSADDEIANMINERNEEYRNFMESSDEEKPKKRRSKHDTEYDDDWFESKGHEYISEDGKTVKRSSTRKRKPTSKFKAMIESDESDDFLTYSSDEPVTVKTKKQRNAAPSKLSVKKEKKTNTKVVKDDAIVETYEMKDKRITVVTAKPAISHSMTPLKTGPIKLSAKSSNPAAGGFANEFAAFLVNSNREKNDLDSSLELKESPKKIGTPSIPKAVTIPAMKSFETSKPCTPGQIPRGKRGRPKKNPSIEPSLPQKQEEWTEKIIKQNTILSNMNAIPNVLSENDRVKAEKIPQHTNLSIGNAIQYPPPALTLIIPDKYKGKTIMVVPSNTIKIKKIS